jgi:hypothetical protein
MSFDLGVFYTETPLSDEDAVKRYVAYCEMEDLSSLIEPNSKVESFLKELTKQFSQIDDWPEEDLDNCPWSIAFDVSEGHILMPMVFSKVEEMYPIIVDLSQKYGLVCVDPQSKCIVTAPPGIKKK